MAVKLRLTRVGKKKQPQYRLVVADSHAPRDGAFIETVGTYNPLTDPATQRKRVRIIRAPGRRTAEPCTHTPVAIRYGSPWRRSPSTLTE